MRLSKSYSCNIVRRVMPGVLCLLFLWCVQHASAQTSSAPVDAAPTPQSLQPFGSSPSERIRAVPREEIQRLANIVADTSRSYEERNQACDALAKFIPAPELVPIFKGILDRVQDHMAVASLSALTLSDERAAAQVILDKYSQWPRVTQAHAQQIAEERLRAQSPHQAWRSVLQLVLRVVSEQDTFATQPVVGEHAVNSSEPSSASAGDFAEAAPEVDSMAASAAFALSGNASDEEGHLILKALDRFPRQPLLWLAAARAKCDLSAKRGQAQSLWRDKAQSLELRLATAALLSARQADAWQFCTREISGVLQQYGKIDAMNLFSQAWSSGSKTQEEQASGRAKMREFLQLSSRAPRLLWPLLIMEEGAARRLMLKAWQARNLYIRDTALALMAERAPQQVLAMKVNSNPLLDSQTLNSYRILIALKHPALRPQVEKIMGQQFQPALDRVRRGAFAATVF